MANDETDEYGGELPELPLTPPHELYFGTVRAIGTPSAEVLESLTSSLSRARVLTELLPLSDQLQRSPSLLRVAPEAFKRLQRDGYAGFMNAGNLLRVSTRRGDAVLSETLAAMDEIRIRSRTTACEPNRTSRAVAYAFKTLVHPEEIRTLRRLYRQTFFSIAIFTPEDSRRRYLSEKLSTRTGARTAEAGQLADRLMASEELNTVDPATPLGQLLRVSPGTSKLLANVEKAYQMADLFIDATERNKVPDQISRFVDLLFGSPWITPTDAELGMGFAYQAALQSGNLSRPVGAAITSPAGDLITIGINDIPRSGGGTQA
ncbi:MAG: deoxycytidylate deaminase, partial [Ilumatobacteraceae bacterium]|nr:deoxycytidylate deaminase [Ilumatobacteraceae bacterium]